MHATKHVNERFSVGIDVAELAMAVKNVCSPCVEACDWQCEHQGKCHTVCGAPCDSLPCEKRCTKKLDCGHQCPSVCGEDCPTSLSCVLCCSQEKQRGKVDVIKFTEYKDLDLDNNPIIFLPCGHFFAMSTLDEWVHLQRAYKQDSAGHFVGIENLANIDSTPKSCPDCRGIIHSVKRYGHLTLFHSLRAFEKKHMVKVDIKLSLLLSSFERAELNREALRGC
ncbi:hypothetical protein ACHAW6_009717 [Cyclotella cf. meneghiniana]